MVGSLETFDAFAEAGKLAEQMVHEMELAAAVEPWWNDVATPDAVSFERALPEETREHPGIYLEASYRVALILAFRQEEKE